MEMTILHYDILELCLQVWNTVTELVYKNSSINTKCSYFIPKIKNFLCEVMNHFYIYHKQNDSLMYFLKTDNQCDTKEFELEFLKITINCALTWIECGKLQCKEVDRNIIDIKANGLIQEIDSLIVNSKSQMDIELSQGIDKELYRNYLHILLIEMSQFGQKSPISNSMIRLNLDDFVWKSKFLLKYFEDEAINIRNSLFGIAKMLISQRTYDEALKLLCTMKEDFNSFTKESSSCSKEFNDVLMQMIVLCELNTNNDNNLTKLYETMNISKIKNKSTELYKFAIEIKRKFEDEGRNNLETNKLIFEKKFECLVIEFNLEENEIIAILNEFYERRSLDYVLSLLLIL